MGVPTPSLPHRLSPTITAKKSSFLLTGCAESAFRCITRRSVRLAPTVSSRFYQAGRSLWHRPGKNIPTHIWAWIARKAHNVAAIGARESSSRYIRSIRTGTRLQPCKDLLPTEGLDNHGPHEQSCPRLTFASIFLQYNMRAYLNKRCAL